MFSLVLFKANNLIETVTIYLSEFKELHSVISLLSRMLWIEHLFLNSAFTKEGNGNGKVSKPNYISIHFSVNYVVILESFKSSLLWNVKTSRNTISGQMLLEVFQNLKWLLNCHRYSTLKIIKYLNPVHGSYFCLSIYLLISIEL